MVWALFWAFLLGTEAAIGCTAFSFSSENQHRFLAKTFDWDSGDLAVRFSQAGTVRPTGPAKFKSLTLHLGEESAAPIGGINEAGLVLEALLCRDVSGASNGATNQIALDQLEWIQHQLDNSRNIDDVIASLEKMSVRLDTANPVHFFGCDPAGCFVVEVIRGKAKVFRKESLPYAALANGTYAKSTQRMTEELPADRWLGPQGRFNRAAKLAASDVKDPLAYADEAFGELENSLTQWKIVYDVDDKSVMVKMKGEAKYRLFSFDQRSPTAPSRTLYFKAGTGNCQMNYAILEN